MITALGSRYADRLQDVAAFLGEENFVLWMARWSIEYVNTIYPTDIPHYTDEKKLYERVQAYEKVTKHQMTALLKILKEDHPTIKFHMGLTSEDIMHNARWSQIIQVIMVLNDEVGKIVKSIDKTCHGLPAILAHTHGQPATPVNCSKYLKAKFLPAKFHPPEFRMGGSNGQLTAWRHVFPAFSASEVADVWMTAMVSKFFVGPKHPTFVISTPGVDVGLLQHGPSNQQCLLSCIGNALRFRSLARALWDHCYRGILEFKSTEGQTGSSAMPHKVNPLDFEQAEGAFSNAYHILIGALEANSDSRGLRDLSNSIVNRNLPDAFAYLFLGLESLVRGIGNAEYSHTKIIEEVQRHPECISEMVRYFRSEIKGEDDEVVYKDLKDSPPDDFWVYLHKMEQAGFDVEFN